MTAEKLKPNRINLFYQNKKEEKPKDMKKRLHLLKERYHELLQDTTFHGLKSVFGTRHWPIRIFWIVSFLTSVGFCSYLIAESFIAYFSYGVLISLTVQRESVSEFPAVTFCNLNPINYYNTAVKSTVMSDYYSKLSKSLVSQPGYSTYICDQTTNSMIQYMLNQPNESNMNSSLYTIYDMLVSCTYNGQECLSEDFVSIFSGSYGNCYTFNTGRSSNGSQVPVQQSIKPGQSNGLQIEMFVGVPDYLPCWVTNMGAIVAVHNKSVVPLLFEEGVNLQTGVQTNLVVSRTFINKLPSPYNDCIKDVTSLSASTSYFYQKTIEKIGFYIQNQCIYLCALETSVADNITECIQYNGFTVSQIRECFQTINNLEPFYPQCFSECPYECDTSYLNVVPNMATYPSPAYSSTLVNKLSDFQQKYGVNPANMSYTDISQSFLSFSVYYDSLIYTEVDDEVAVDFGDTLASVGGTMGLFLGISILSLLEIVELIYELIYVFFSCSCSLKSSSRNKINFK